MKTMRMNDINDVDVVMVIETVISSIDDVDSFWLEQSDKSEHLDWDRLLIMIIKEDEDEIYLYKCATINQCNVFPPSREFTMIWISVSLNARVLVMGWDLYTNPAVV